MAVVAAIAVAVAAFFADVAVNRFTVGPWAGIPPTVYAMLWAPAIAFAATRRPRPIRLALPAGTRRAAALGAGAVALFVVSAHRLPDSAAGAVVALAALAAPVVGACLWPQPGAFRLSLALSTVILATPGADPLRAPGTLVAMGAAAAVALVATTRLPAPRLMTLGDPPRARPRRLAAEAAAVALALLLASLLSHRMDQPRRPSAGQPRSGRAANGRQQPSPLDGTPVLDPNQAGPGGRGIDPDTPLLAVGADRAGVLRAVTYDQWDGRRWLREDVVRESPSAVSHRFASLIDTDQFEPFRGGVAEQRVRVLAALATVAAGTPRIYAYEVPDAAVVDLDGTTHLLPALGRGGTYVANTVAGAAPADELRAAGAGQPTPAAGDEGLRGDPGLSPRARALVAEITAGAPTDYDKVAALSSWLSTHVRVSDRAPALAAGTDPVDTVLFGGPASPERLATTLALLTRSVGIPSRLAVGFLPGRRPLLGGDFVVRAGDAHAWVEVPFNGLGWQRFDPSGRIAAAEHQDSLWSRLRRAWHRFWPVVVALVVLLAAFVAYRVFERRRRRLALPWVTRYFARLTRLGARRGRPRRPSETPVEYTSALAEGVLADERLVEVGRLVTDAAWSGREPPADTRRWAEEVLDEAARATRRRRRSRV